MPDLRVVAALALLVAAFAAGVVLVMTASMDDDNRNNIGVGLMSTAGIGLALFLFEQGIDRRRARREREAAIQRRSGFIESVRLAIADLVIDHVKELAMMLMSASDLPDSKAAPAGWQGKSDKELVTRGLMWAAELPRQDKTWWRVPRNLAAVDALFVVATDIAERSLLDTSAEEARRLHGQVGRSLARIGMVAERLSQSGDPYGAHDIDRLCEVLRSGDVRGELFDLGGWGTEACDCMITSGGYFDQMRGFVAYLVDRLRADEALAASPHPCKDNDEADVIRRRWAAILDLDGTSIVPSWEDRFREDGWMRKPLQRMSDELRAVFGIRPQRHQDRIV